MEVENVFKIATTYPKVRGYLTSGGWEFRGKDPEMKMDSYRNSKSGRQLCAEDISDGFPVTFLIGELSLKEFGAMAGELAPRIRLLEVESSWEGESTIIVVAMTERQVWEMFGRGTRMKPISVRPTVRA